MKYLVFSALLAAAAPAAACDFHGGFGPFAGGYYDGYETAPPVDPVVEREAAMAAARTAFLKRFNVLPAPVSEAGPAAAPDQPAPSASGTITLN
jgi:hypothetical protein